MEEEVTQEELKEVEDKAVDFMNPARYEGETMEMYKYRRSTINKMLKRYLSGMTVYQSNIPYRKENINA